MLQILKTKHLLQLTLSFQVTGSVDMVEVSHHAIYVSAAVLRHAFLNWDKVAPLSMLVIGEHKLEIHT